MAGCAARRDARPSTRMTDPHKHNLAHLRTEYMQAALDERDVERDPRRQFARWFEAAVAARVPEPNAMTLATVDAEGRPSARIVLLKEVDATGFTFYTNYESRKGRELAANPRAALTWHWPWIEEQVRAEGSVEFLPAEESDRYYASRPRGSQLGAWASRQSEPLARREQLLARYDELATRFADHVPLPDFWGGYRLRPERIEFWQGRVGRLHDRLLYVREGDAWRRNRLNP